MFHDKKDPFEEAERLINEASNHCRYTDDSLIADLPEIVVTALRLLLSDFDRPAMRERSRTLACRLLAVILPRIETFAQRALEEKLNADKKERAKRKQTTTKLNT
jgi:hypothetical protein